MHDTKIAGTTQRNDLCMALPDELRQILLSNEKTVTAPNGAQLLTQGKFVQHLILLKSGSVQISLACPGREMSWTLDRPGQIFGMRAIISGQVSEIDVTCVRQCEVGLFERDFFLAMLKAYPEIYFAVSRILSFDLKIANRILFDRRQEIGAKAIAKKSLQHSNLLIF